MPGGTPLLPFRLQNMLPAMAKLLLPKYSQFARRLDLAVNDSLMEEHKRRSPNKAELKAIRRQLQEVAE